MVIDNRPGAGATLGHGLAAKAAPDGYTILLASLPQVLPHVRTGWLKVLGVGHSTRLKATPEIPTIVESVPGLSNPAWWGVPAAV